MLVHEDFCVECQEQGLPCLGDICNARSVPVHYCDRCGDQADWVIDGQDYCSCCAWMHLRDIFDQLTIQEMAEMLGVQYMEL